MKILITGGCGFIGSHVAAKFYKEGHDIYIIDDLSTGNIKNLEVPHKFYNVDIASKYCEDIFKSNKFDVVINLSAQVDVKTSFEAPFLDSKSNLLGITNMLDLSRKYGVKKFIFASSAAVYGNTDKIPIKEDAEINPISPYGMSKYVGEFYCRKWHEIYGLKTIYFRFSNVFGPKQGLKGESGVISIFMDKLIKNKGITVFGDGNQSRDFIYVDDVATGIYKAFESDYTGVLNLSTNTHHTLNELIVILSGFRKIKKIVYKEASPCDIRNSQLDNAKLKEVLKWSPNSSFKDSLKKTYIWYENYYNSQDSKDTNKTEVSNRKSSKKSLLLKSIPYIENLLGILIIIFLNFFILKNHNMLSYTLINICYIYIVILGVIYGVRHSLISAVCSSALYLYLLLNSGYNVISILYDPSNSINIAGYMIIGIIVGYSTDVNNRKLYLDKLKFHSISDKYNFLEDIYSETKLIKDELENQIISSDHSLGTIYNITKDLNSFEFKHIYKSSINVIETLLKTNEVSIYSLSKDEKHLILEARSSKDKFLPKESIDVDEFPEIKSVIYSKKIFVNRNLNDKLPIMTAPIIADEKTKAVICIYEVKFENLTLYYENLFKVLTNLISCFISKAYEYDRLVEKNNPITNTVEEKD